MVKTRLNTDELKFPEKKITSTSDTNSKKHIKVDKIFEKYIYDVVDGFITTFKFGE